jgi:GNAT superfamily N-acetyltransferase
MKLVKSKSERCWNTASSILKEVVEWLEENNSALWNLEQVSVSSLKESYNIDELYFLEENGENIGLVFLQESDELFWPEVEDRSTLFVHKLSLREEFKSKGYGMYAMNLIKEKARAQGALYIRLDCDVRQVLISFYSACGFTIVDYKKVLEYRVARLECKC